VQAYADQAAHGPLEAWLGAQRLGRPYVTWKYAATLDGRSAAADGTSRWITGAEARADVHRLRAEVDAVAVGIGTVLADDPQLTVRSEPAPKRQPLRVVFDRHARTPTSARVLDSEAETLITAEPPAQALAELRKRGVVSVLLEGGPTLAGAFWAEGLIDKVVGYYAPALLGSGRFPVLIGGGIDTISAAGRLVLHDVTRIGDDVRLTSYPKGT
jgi:diaminohydroxyphosphoribosylaminopyrimidine deaminase/5-amino-6-(5-phosphoribosylamino)uracil reductase